MRSIVKHLRRSRNNQTMCLLLLASLLISSAPGRARKTSHLDDLYKLFEVDLPPADIAILLDASRSMIGHQYGDVRRSIIGFTPLLTDKERVQLRVFGDTVGSPLEGNGIEVAGGVEGYLPPEPFFSHTDLGLAILKGLEFLERADAGQVQAFFLMTDGLHQPPADSPYSRDFDTDPDWQELRQRAETLCLRRTVFVYGFGLGRQTDISVLRRVFPARNVEVVVGDAAQVGYALRRVRERLSRTQLRQAVERELNDGRVDVSLAQSSVSGSNTDFDVPVTIRNGYRRLPVRIEQVKVERGRGAAPEIHCTMESSPSGVALEGGGQWQGRVEGELKADLPGWRIGQSAQEFNATFAFAPVVRFQHEAALGELGLDSNPSGVAPAVLSVDLRASYGLPCRPFVLIFLFVAASAGAAAVRRRQLERQRTAVSLRHAERRLLGGRLRVWPARKEEPEEEGLDLSQHGGEKLDLRLTEDGALEIILPEEAAGEVVARLSGHLVRANLDEAESGKEEFRVEAAGDHKLAYESGGEMRETSSLTLCDGDLLEVDGRWRLRYTNYRLRTRAEVESAQSGDFSYDQ